MILYVQGDLFQSPAQVLVNTVNTKGVMGKGVALQFKQLFPEMFEQYRDLCEQGKIDIGKLWLYKSPHKWVLNFPTKKHWRYPSKLEYVIAGLEKFVRSYDEMGIHSIAFPPLGCGNGQLDFKTQVQPIMHQYLSKLPIDVFVYPDRNDPFVPEHLDSEEMRRWLRIEPTLLPFSEVWEDLRRLLKHKNLFTTVVRDSTFRAYVTEDLSGIDIEAAGSNYHIPQENLRSFWQQLRAYGFSMRNIAPGIDRKISYLVAIFAELDYVKPVRASDQYSNFDKDSGIGLQILPAAFARHHHVTQMSLFTFE
jgi:O-acetyl-ADP-ribose deacetylase (regulator of RNase III)